ncbi:MAG: GTPase HflX [Bacteroidota bacterium]
MESAILVGVIQSGTTREQVDDSLNELELLADTAGAKVKDRLVQSLARINAATYIGKGKVTELKAMAEAYKADMVIFDDDLSTVQVRNLEKILKCKLLDRSALILDIFASRAKTATAKTQVELAQLEYLRTRLTRQWTHLSRQKGGIGFKGPGETQIETDRRLISTRISTLKKRLDKIDKQRKTQRKGRHQYTRISLVGYTNAGKSTLMNTLADTQVLAEDRLFATLDATTRQVRLAPNKEVLLSDTVGFIRKLPHRLIESFKSTLDEVRESDLLLHVVDVTHPRFEDHIAVVKMTLGELGALEVPMLMVFNKVDGLKDRAIINGLKQAYENSVFTSALRGIGLPALKEQVLKEIESSFTEYTALIPLMEAKAISKIRNLAAIVSEEYMYARNGKPDVAPLAVAKLTFRAGAYHKVEIEQLVARFADYKVVEEA